MERRNHWIILVGIFIISAAIKFLLLSNYGFSEESYFHIRQMDSIRESFLPIFNDQLSYGGRTIIFSPVFDYLLAIFTFFSKSKFALYILYSILASLSVFPIFLLARKLTDNSHVSLIASTSVLFLPAFYMNSNVISTMALGIPLLLMCFYLFLSDKYYWYIALTFMLAVLTPISFIMIISLFVYWLFLKLEKIEMEQEKLEVLLSSAFLALWVHFLIYKRAIFRHGLGVLWGNRPFLYTLQQSSVIEFLLALSPLLIVIGIYVIYKYFTKYKNKYFLSIFSLFIVALFLFALNMISTRALVIITVCFVLFFALFLKTFFAYASNIRFLSKQVCAAILMLILIASSVPFISYSKPGSAESKADALKWINNSVDRNVVVLADIKDGHMITYFAKKRNVADDYFIGVDFPAIYIKDIETFYKTKSEIEALEIAGKYNIGYFLFSEDYKAKYGVESISYIGDKKCFSPVYKNKGATIYRIICGLETE